METTSHNFMVCYNFCGENCDGSGDIYVHSKSKYLVEQDIEDIKESIFSHIESKIGIVVGLKIAFTNIIYLSQCEQETFYIKEEK